MPPPLAMANAAAVMEPPLAAPSLPPSLPPVAVGAEPPFFPLLLLRITRLLLLLLAKLLLVLVLPLWLNNATLAKVQGYMNMAKHP